MLKKNYIAMSFITSMILTLTCYTQNANASWVAFKDNAQSEKLPPVVEKTSSDTKEIVIRYTIPGMEVLESVEERDGLMYQHLNLPHNGLFVDVGKPELPQIGKRFGIPKGASVQVEVVTATSQILEGYSIYPSQKSLVGNEEDTEFEKDMAAYEKDEFYPSQIAVVDEAEDVRGMNVSIVRLIPFQFNPVKRQLKVYSDVQIKISFIGGSDFFLDREFRTPMNEAFYMDMINFSDVGSFNEQIVIDGICSRYDQREEDEEDGGQGFLSSTGGTECFACHGFEHIIITDSAYANAAKDLMKWNNQKGIMTDYVTTQNIGSTTTAIKNFITSAYNMSAHKPQHITLLGEVGYVPTYLIGLIQRRSDLYYVTMGGGNDWEPDMTIGRIPVPTGNANGVIGKIVNYEKTPYTSINWYNNVLIAAASETDMYNWNLWFRPTSDLIYNYLDGINYNGNQQYKWDDPPQGPPAGGGTTANIVNAISSGVSIVNYKGHGTPYGWEYLWFGSNEAANLTNGQMLPVMFSITCRTGSFHITGPNPGDNSLGNALLRETSKGVAGFIGASDSSSPGESDWLDRGLYDSVWVGFDDSYQSGARTQMGHVLKYGKEYSKQHYNTTLTKDHYEMFHYLGCPTMNLRTANPGSLVAYHNATIPRSGTFAVQVKDGCGYVIPNAMVTLSTLDKYYYHAKGVTNSSGWVYLSVDYDSSGSAYLTVTKYNGYNVDQAIYNYKPSVETLSVQ